MRLGLQAVVPPCQDALLPREAGVPAALVQTRMTLPPRWLTLNRARWSCSTPAVVSWTRTMYGLSPALVPKPEYKWERASSGCGKALACMLAGAHGRGCTTRHHIAPANQPATALTGVPEGGAHVAAHLDVDLDGTIITQHVRVDVVVVAGGGHHADLRGHTEDGRVGGLGLAWRCAVRPVLGRLLTVRARQPQLDLAAARPQSRVTITIAAAAHHQGGGADAVHV